MQSQATYNYKVVRQFAVMTVVQFFVVLLVFPETAGITLEDMQRKMES